MNDDNVFEKAIKEILTKRNEIIENFMKTWLAVNLPLDYDAHQSMDYWINHCVLIMQNTFKDGNQVEKYWIEYRSDEIKRNDEDTKRLDLLSQNWGQYFDKINYNYLRCNNLRQSIDDALKEGQ